MMVERMELTLSSSRESFRSYMLRATFEMQSTGQDVVMSFRHLSKRWLTIALKYKAQRKNCTHMPSHPAFLRRDLQSSRARSRSQRSVYPCPSGEGEGKRR